MNVTFVCPLWLDNDFWLAVPTDYGSINTEPGTLDMMDRYWMERASGAETLLKEIHWDCNGVDMDYKKRHGCLMEHVRRCAFLKDTIKLDAR